MGKLIVLENDYLQVKISPEVGASIYSLKYKKEGRWLDIMRPTPEKALEEKEVGDFASFNLFPYSNRIENGLLKFNGKEYQLKINFDDGHAIHGEAWTRPWQVSAVEKNSVSLEFHSIDFDDISWPVPFRAEMKYYINENKFIIKMGIKNTGEKLMPAGMGIHPYFMRKLNSGMEKINLQMNTLGLYPGETQIPTGPWQAPPEKLNFTDGKELPAVFLDDCFRVERGPIIIEWKESDVKLTIAGDELLKHVVIYCPVGEEFFALEPVSNCNNGFNMAAEGIGDTGTLLLEPGKKAASEVSMKFE
ncbi:MAG: aldose 1-epimerase [Halanaerobiaceae bacterium]